MISVTFQNWGGNGFGESREVPEGTTLANFLREEMGSEFEPGSYRIKVNGVAAPSNQVLQNGDAVQVRASQKNEGAVV